MQHEARFIDAGNNVIIKIVLQYNGDHTLVDVRSVRKSLIQKRGSSKLCQEDGVSCPVHAGTQFSFSVDIQLPKTVLVILCYFSSYHESKIDITCKLFTHKKLDRLINVKIELAIKFELE